MIQASFKKNVIVPIAYTGNLSRKIKIGSKLDQGQLINTFPYKKDLDAEAQTSNFNEILSPVVGEVVGIGSSQIIVDTNGFELNLFDALGQGPIMGEVFYSISSKIFTKTFDIHSIANKLLVTDTLSFDQYAKLNAMGIQFVLVNHIKFEVFYSIQNMKLPIGIITGFGECNINKNLYKIFESASTQNNLGIFDSDYKRFIIPGLEKGAHNASFSINLSST